MLLQLLIQEDAEQPNLQSRTITIKSSRLLLKQALQPLFQRLLLSEADFSLQYKIVVCLSQTQQLQLQLAKSIDEQLQNIPDPLILYCVKSELNLVYKQQILYPQVRVDQLPPQEIVNPTQQMQKPQIPPEELLQIKIKNNQTLRPVFVSAQLPYFHPTQSLTLPFSLVVDTRGYNELNSYIPPPQIVKQIENQLGCSHITSFQLKSNVSDPKTNPNAFEVMSILRFNGTFVLAYMQVSTNPHILRVNQALPFLSTMWFRYEIEKQICQVYNEFGSIKFHCDSAGQICYLKGLVNVFLEVNSQKSVKSLILQLKDIRALQVENLPAIEQKDQSDFTNPLLDQFKYFLHNTANILSLVQLDDNIFTAEKKQYYKKQPGYDPKDAFIFFNVLRKVLIDTDAEKQNEFFAFLVQQIEETEQRIAFSACMFATFCVKALLINTALKRMDWPQQALEFVSSIALGETSLSRNAHNGYLIETCYSVLYMIQLIQEGVSCDAHPQQQSKNITIIQASISNDTLDLQPTQIGQFILGSLAPDELFYVVHKLLHGNLIRQVLLAENCAPQLRKLDQEKFTFLQNNLLLNSEKLLINLLQPEPVSNSVHLQVINTYIYNGDEYIQTCQGQIPSQFIQNNPLSEEDILELWQYQLQFKHDAMTFVDQIKPFTAKLARSIKQVIKRLQLTNVQLFDFDSINNVIYCSVCSYENYQKHEDQRKLTEIIAENPKLEQAINLLSYWRLEKCQSFSDLYQTGIDRFVKPEIYVREIVIPTRQQFATNSLIYLLHIQQNQAFTQQLKAKFTDNVIQPHNYHQDFMNRLEQVTFKLPNSLLVSKMQLTTAQDVALYNYFECVETAVRNDQYKEIVVQNKAETEAEIKQVLHGIVEKISLTVAKNKLTQQLKSGLQQFESGLKKEQDTLQMKHSQSLNQTEKDLKNFKPVKYSSQNPPYLQFQLQFLLLSQRYNYLCKAGHEMMDSMKACQCLNQECVIPLIPQQYKINSQSKQFKGETITLLCADGEVKVPEACSRMILHSSKLIAINERKQIIEEFVKFLGETTILSDVLQQKYDLSSFLVASTSTTCLIGLLGCHLSQPDTQLLEAIKKFSFDDAVRRIYVHPLFDYYCFICYQASIDYELYRERWDVFLAFKVLKRFLEQKYAVSEDALKLLFRKVTNIDLQQFTVPLQETLDVLSRIAPQIKSVTIKNLNEPIITSLQKLRQLNQVLVVDKASSMGWVDLLSVSVRWVE
ncbi:Hypothetical_protein [Hexamita inflata]|uniref:Hypothetical_protein n=1 Tax=Hexamita inflata TaxID=28002 RepID=A0AA86R630_9EUKA|nr:Hypothetical protein HINF_LOCUS54563 [Hexamita inflata]